ncbi:MAG: ABC transporter ATP-binding protein [Verrucomicrobia bacterium]|nr:ABC transporter ATP-binding protein [Verrucomicrobiota bacterium]
MNPADPIITCKDVCVAYGRQEVLHRVNLEIPRGVFLPFTGPNGAGKTTLLRAILGLLPLRRGKIDTPFDRHPAGYMPQQKVIDPLYPVSTRQIVEMGLYPERGWLRRITAPQRRAVDQTLEQLSLAEHADKNFRELSGGMKQKALLARAFVSKAEVFIVDEPTSELDEASEKEVLHHLLQLSREQGKTVLVAHHDLGLMATLTDSMCHVRHGNASIEPVRQESGADA